MGLTWRPLDLGDLDEGPDVLLAIARPARRDELAEARDLACVYLATRPRQAGADPSDGT